MLDGRSWMLAEVPQDMPLSYHDSQSAGNVGGSRQNSRSRLVARTDPPTVVTQHLQIDRQFVIINSKVKNSVVAVILPCEKVQHFAFRASTLLVWHKEGNPALAVFVGFLKTFLGLTTEPDKSGK